MQHVHQEPTRTTLIETSDQKTRNFEQNNAHNDGINKIFTPSDVMSQMCPPEMDSPESDRLSSKRVQQYYQIHHTFSSLTPNLASKPSSSFSHQMYNGHMSNLYEGKNFIISNIPL